MTESEGRALTPSDGLVDRRFGVFWTTLGVAAGLLFLIAVMAGCSTIVDKGEEIEVTKTQYQQFWPVIVESGTLLCMNPTGRRQGEAVFRAPDGVTYALNDTATELGHADINTITADNPRQEGGKMNPFRFTELAMDECY